MKGYKDYYYGYIDSQGNKKPGYEEMINNLNSKYPLSDPSIIGEQNQKEFIALFGAILRMKNLLSSFDEFEGKQILSDRDFQDYCGRYLDLKEDWKNKNPESEAENINDDVVFEIELLKQIEINIDYILMLVQKFHDSHSEDKEVLISIQKAIDSSPELRSKKALIENFINGINEVEDVVSEWRTYVAEEKEKELKSIIDSEGLKEEETRQFVSNCFESGTVKTTGTDIDKLMPPTSRFGSGNHDKKKKSVVAKILAFFERFFGIM